MVVGTVVGMVVGMVGGMVVGDECTVVSRTATLLGFHA